MEFESALTEDGYRRVLIQLAARRLRFAPAIVGAAAFIAYGSGLRTEALGLFGTLLAVPLVVWGYVSWLSGSPSARQLYVPVRYSLNPDGVCYSSAEGDGELAWSEVVRWRKAAGHLLLYVSSSRYLLLVVDGLAEETQAAVEGVLSDKVHVPARDAGALR